MAATLGTRGSVSSTLDDEIRKSTYPRIVGFGFLDNCSPKIRRMWEFFF